MRNAETVFGSNIRANMKEFAPKQSGALPLDVKHTYSHSNIMKFLYYLFHVILGSMWVCDAYRILLVFPNLSRSHTVVAFGYVKHLLKAGHEVTIITPYTQQLKPQPSLRLVDVSDNLKMFKLELFTIKAVMGDETLSNFYELFKVVLKLFTIEEVTIKNPNVQKLLNDDTVQFDLVIAEWFHSNVFCGFATVYNCPLIWSSTTEAHSMVLSLVDESPSPAYNSNMNLGAIPPFTFAQRVIQLGILAVGNLFQYLYSSNADKSVYEKMFRPIVEKRGRVLPPYEEVVYNGSLLFSNSHPTYGPAMKLPPNTKEIGGFWIDKETEPLPKDLQNLMDNAKHGVIYFSMGSIWKSKDMPISIKQDILKVFRELEQTVIWKLEEEFPDLPKNVHIVKWAPQHSILAHPNLRLFITHGGVFSLAETVFYGVPVVGIPVAYDQRLNIARAEQRGFGRHVKLRFNIAEDLKLAIQDVLSNISYKIRAKEVSQVYHDRVVPLNKEVVHWVEHVVRTGGAPHLRSPALLVPWYQKMYLDLLALTIVIIAFIVIVIKLCRRNKKRIPDIKKTQ